ncbi:MAG: hypothetical protein LQ344_006850 [Seirophora lacunosa]|nr:MAG: hypothetical protein LQ344_006850 [Seirophora lacunosa]
MAGRHLKEQNYGADWGDFVSFTRLLSPGKIGGTSRIDIGNRHMKHRAGNLGVDLLLIDTGDLHDGNGLSDASTPNGVISNAIFENVDYDLLTIGNHELYVTDIAYETFNQFSKVYGDRYVTSNVQIMNPATGKFEYIGSKYRYFTTDHGLRIMAFGVLFDFTGNSNVSKVIKARDLVKEEWFLEAVNYPEPVDLFIVVGHNPVRTTKAIKVSNATSTANSSVSSSATSNSSSMSHLVYSRRYLDWNRLTFEYHAVGSQASTFDLHSGERVTTEITKARKQLNLTALYGCAPETYCQSCKPFGADGNIFGFLETALAATVVNESRADIPRLIIINTGTIRFDLVKGPFTLYAYHSSTLDPNTLTVLFSSDDSFIVSPFKDAFQFIPNVPYSLASQVLGILNAGPFQKRSIDTESQDLSTRDFSFSTPLIPSDACTASENIALRPRSSSSSPLTRSLRTRQTPALFPGYITTDDFGTDGDDTPHSAIPFYRQPNDIQANASFPAFGGLPDAVDLVFLDFIGEDYVIPALNSVGGDYSIKDVEGYLPEEFTTNSYLPEYARRFWQKGVPNCPVGTGVGGS